MEVTETVYVGTRAAWRAWRVTGLGTRGITHPLP